MAQRQRPRDRERPDRGDELIGRRAPRPAVKGLHRLLDDLETLAGSKDTVTIAALLDTVGARGHGPIILTLAGLMMLPTGMIPLMPAIIGVLLGMTAVQMILGGKGVSLPRRITRLSISSEKLDAALRRAAPLNRRIGRVLHPRWPVLVTGNVSLTLIAAILLLAGIAMVVIGSIPGLPFVLSIPALLFGLGLTAGDGRVVALGYIAALVGLGVGIILLPQALTLLSGA